MLATLVAATALGPSAAEARTPCAQRGDETIARNSVARVFEKDGVRYGCAYRRNQAYLVRGGQGTYGYGPIRLAGYLMAYDNDESGNIDIRNLRTGGRRRVSPQPRAFGATDLELKDNGAFADLRLLPTNPRNDPALPYDFVFEIRRVDSRGPLLLARGSDIDPDSLVLRGSYIRWRQGGVVRRATLR